MFPSTKAWYEFQTYIYLFTKIYDLCYTGSRVPKNNIWIFVIAIYVGYIIQV